MNKNEYKHNMVTLLFLLMVGGVEASRDRIELHLQVIGLLGCEVALGACVVDLNKRQDECEHDGEQDSGPREPMDDGVDAGAKATDDEP